MQIDHSGIVVEIGFDERVVGEHLVEMLANKGDCGTAFKSIIGSWSVFGGLVGRHRPQGR